MKQKKYSIRYWLKNNYVGRIEDIILNAVRVYAENCEHPEIEFTGMPIEFANELYVEWKRRGTICDGLYPTPLDVAERAVVLLLDNIEPGSTVLDPGCGFGNLSYTAQKFGLNTLSIDYNNLACEIARLVGIDNVVRGDFVGNEYDEPCHVGLFDAVVVNPPFGKIFRRKTDIATDFMTRIADLSSSGAFVSAILPNGFMNKDRPRAHVEMQERYRVLHVEQIRNDAFSPLTNISTELYLLQTVNNNKLIDSPKRRAYYFLHDYIDAQEQEQTANSDMQLSLF